MAHMVDTKVLSVALSKVNNLNKNKDSFENFLSDSYNQSHGRLEKVMEKVMESHGI